MSTVRLMMVSSLLIVTIISATNGAEPNKAEDSIYTLDVIKARGFRAQMYSLKSGSATLTLYRIINPLANPATLNKYPVLYGHGLAYDSHLMVSRSERSRPREPKLGAPTIYHGNTGDGSDDNSFPFMLSNNNFDVWLYDARGVNEINRNVSTTTDMMVAQKFWDFSLDEEALVDLPLLINFVLTKTASQKLVYASYSQSTFFMFALLSMMPEYKDKVAAIVAMAPIAYLAHIRGLAVPLYAPIASAIPDYININAAPQPVVSAIDATMKNFCKIPHLGKLVCGAIVDSFAGEGQSQRAPGLFSFFLTSTSAKVGKHLLQLFVQKRFGMYDYGPIANMQRYGQSKAPNYDLRRVASDRIILARGLRDFLSAPEDQIRLIDELGTKPYLDIIVPNYNHFDWIDGKDLIRLVNGPAMIAVYELMYKDGPNVLRSPQQYQEILQRVSLGPQEIDQTQLPSHEKVPESEFMQKLFGTNDLIGHIFGK